MNYLQYHIASGSVVAQVEMDPRFAIDRDGCGYAAGTGTQDRHWVDSGAICARSPYDAHSGPSYIEQGAAPIPVMTRLPDPCWARIRGTGNQPFSERFVRVEGGTLMFVPEITGTYSVTLEGQYSSAAKTFEIVSLDQFKVRRNDEVSDQKMVALSGGMILDGHRWDTDPAAQLSINSMASAANAGIPLPADFYWTTYDNADVPFAKDNLLALSAAVAAFNFAVHDRSRVLKSQIAAATTIGEVEAIDVTAGWPN